MARDGGAIRSMTGFGAAERATDALAVRAEMKSVNARGLKLSVKAPSLLDPHLSAIEAGLKDELRRGTVTVSVSLRRTGGDAASSIDTAVLKAYLEQVRSVEADLGDAAGTRLAELLRLPGVIETGSATPLTDAETQSVVDAVTDALAGLVAMREREGAGLETELRDAADELARLADVVEARVPAALEAHQDRLAERLERLLGDSGAVPEDLLAREVAVLAERSDVAEELSRLRSHLEQWREALDAGGAVGRRLDFLAQELGREANTLASKSSDSELSRTAMDARLVVDRMKEQAANVE